MHTPFRPAPDRSRVVRALVDALRFPEYEPAPEPAEDSGFSIAARLIDYSALRRSAAEQLDPRPRRRGARGPADRLVHHPSLLQGGQVRLLDAAKPDIWWLTE